MAESRHSTVSVVLRKISTIFKPKKKEKNLKKGNNSKKKDSEASKQPEAGGKGNEIPPANAPAASTTKATTFSTPAVASTILSAPTEAGTPSPATSAAIRSSDNIRKENENVMVPPEQAPKDISQGTHGPSKAIPDTGGTTASPNKTAEPSPKGSKDKGPGAEHEAAGGNAAPGNTSEEKHGEEAVPKPKPDPDDNKFLFFKETPVWNQAVEEWRKTHRKDFDKFKSRTASSDQNVTESGPSDNAGDWLTELKPADKTPRQAAARLKRWQPLLSSLRGIAMVAARFDHHNIAPIVCATIFGSLDILFNFMNPEDRDKILDTLCQCGNTIKEGNTFEITYFNKSHPAVAGKMTKIHELLKRQYLTALIFACKISNRCEDMQMEFMVSDEYRRKNSVSWFTSRGNLLWHNMSNEVLEWEGGLKELGRLKSEWAVRKDDVKESIARDDQIVKVLEWLRKKDYPDPSPSDIRSRVMPDGLYSNGADWFLKDDAFQAFCAGFGPPNTTNGERVESSASDDQGGNSTNTSHKCDGVKRVLWLRGGLGMGKTTVLSLVFAHLSTFRGPALERETEVRIVPYFCDASKIGTKLADCETIIRAMIRRMALQPDGTLAEAAKDLHTVQQSSAANDGDLTLKDHWVPLLRKLISAGSGYHFVFLVDALDECDKPTDWEKLLRFMNGIIQSYPNVSFICSSHAHVRVDTFFRNEAQDSSIVAIEDVNARRNSKAISAYINGEIQRREADAGGSIFYHTDFLDELRKTLLRNARGVFQWAKIWLDILLAVEDTDRRTIKSETDARNWLERLKNDSRKSATDDELLTNGYKRLWDITCIREHDDFEQRARLFHFVLAANITPTLQMLSTVLRVRNNKFDRYPQLEDTMRLCSNFLILNDETKSLEFIHTSAYNFIRDLNMKQDKLAEGGEEKFFSDYRNHESIARLYMDLIGSAAHPYWTKIGIEMNKWKSHAFDSIEVRSIIQGLAGIGRTGDASDSILATYLMAYGLQHFPNAAQKPSLDDPIWKGFIERLVQSSDSVLGALLLNNTDTWFFDNSFKWWWTNLSDGRSCLDLVDGQLRILSSHILACLPVFDEYDHVCSTSTRDTAGAPKFVELFQDMCTLGGHFEDTLAAQQLAASLEGPPLEANALQLACTFDNAGTVRAILHAAKRLPSNTLNTMLRSRTESCSYPLDIAIEHRNVTIASMLLEVDRQVVDQAAGTEGPESPSPRYISSQWELRIRFGNFGTGDILRKAVMGFQQTEMLRLLEVAWPEDINAYDGEGETLLNFMLAHKINEVWAPSPPTQRVRTLIWKHRSISGRTTKIRSL